MIWVLTRGKSGTTAQAERDIAAVALELRAPGCTRDASITWHSRRIAPLHPPGLGSRMTTPALDRWSEDEALRELARLARDLPDVDAGEAWRRLGRLTAEQRGKIIEALEDLGGRA